MAEVSEAIKRVSHVDLLSDETESKTPTFELEIDKPIEEVDPPGQFDRSQTKVIQEDPEKEKASPEMSGKMIASAVETLIGIGDMVLNAKAAKKMSMEDWFYYQQAKDKKQEDLSEPEMLLMAKVAQIEEKLKKAKEENDLEPDEKADLEYWATLLAKEKGFAATATQGFYLQLLKVLGLKAYNIYQF